MGQKRQIFYSFHYKNDVMRVAQLRNIGALEDNKPASENDWEEVKKKNDAGIEKWIDENMNYRTCVVVMVGEDTSNRKWVKHEIKKAWIEKRGILGIYIHNVNCPRNGNSKQGSNPFNNFTIKGKNMSEIVKCYNPKSNDAYNDIKSNLENWIEEAIKIRNEN
jgi:MTH538 TIR-like domain (DUF1863)